MSDVKQIAAEFSAAGMCSWFQNWMNGPVGKENYRDW